MQITISDGALSVEITGHKSSLAARTNEALSGWYSTPDAKVETTERQGGHGAHDVTGEMVLYSARTVTIDLLAMGYSRSETLAVVEQVQRMAGKVITMRVVDGGRDTYATGYISTEWAAARYEGVQQGGITVVCPDPRRYSTQAAEATLAPVTGASGGLMFDESTGVLLTQPVQFHGETESGNSATLANAGTSTAYPVITVSGRWPQGVTISHSGGQLAYGAAVNSQALVLDCKSRTASINGVDVTRNLTSRGFPQVEPGGDIRLSCLSAGNGAVTVQVRDTYI